jgi:hypothetical protein
MSDQPVAETSDSTTEKHPLCWRYSNPQCQQANGPQPHALDRTTTETGPARYTFMYLQYTAYIVQQRICLHNVRRHAKLSYKKYKRILMPVVNPYNTYKLISYLTENYIIEEIT